VPSSKLRTFAEALLSDRDVNLDDFRLHLLKPAGTFALKGEDAEATVHNVLTSTRAQERISERNHIDPVYVPQSPAGAGTQRSPEVVSPIEAANQRGRRSTVTQPRATARPAVRKTKKLTVESFVKLVHLGRRLANSDPST
jgi:hypothetical protein